MTAMKKSRNFLSFLNPDKVKEKINVKKSVEFVKHDLFTKKTLLSMLPYGKPIEKLYLLVLVVSFGVFLFKEGSIVTEDKIIVFAVALGGLFVLRSMRKKIY